MIFKILQIRQQFKDAKSAANDPKAFTQETVSGMIKGYIFSIAFTTFFVLLALGLFGYAEILGGPYGFARFLFWATLILTIIAAATLAQFYSFIKRQIKNQGQPGLGKDSNVIDVEPE